MENLVVIREAQEMDHPFIFALSPYLAEVAQLEWHTDDAIQKMQDDYISEMLVETSKPSITLIAESNNVPLGFIHVRTHNDSISDETCGTIPLLAVSPKSQGLGLGKVFGFGEEKSGGGLQPGLTLVDRLFGSTPMNVKNEMDYIGSFPQGGDGGGSEGGPIDGYKQEDLSFDSFAGPTGYA